MACFRLILQLSLTSTDYCTIAKHIHPEEKALFDNFFDVLAVKLTAGGRRQGGTLLVSEAIVRACAAETLEVESPESV